MSSYTLRSIPPFFSAPYATSVLALSLELTEFIFSPITNLIGAALSAAALTFTPLMRISVRMMLLSLSLGGLSLRLPESLTDIAYAATCVECIPHLKNSLLKRLNVVYLISLISGLGDVPKSAACSRFNSVFPLAAALGPAGPFPVARIPPVGLLRLSGLLFDECIVHDTPLDGQAVGQSWL